MLAARAVDLACSGNIKAIGLIAERIEGRVGMRPDEVAPEDEARREDMQAVIESVVTALVNARLASADDSPEDFGLGSHARRDQRLVRLRQR